MMASSAPGSRADFSRIVRTRLCSRALFAKAEAVFTKALKLAPKDKVIIYSFAVTLSIKLRLVLFDTGASLQDLDKTRFAIRERERLHNLKVRGRVVRF